MRGSHASQKFMCRRFLPKSFFRCELHSWRSAEHHAGAATKPVDPSTDYEVSRREAGRSREGRGASPAHHFDRVLIIVLENVDYEVASQDKNLADLAAGGASFTNFHALFHPSYPNYLAMVAGTDFGIHRRGRLLADNQVNFTADSAHQSIADRLIAAGLDFKQYAEELPEGTCPWNFLGAACGREARQLHAAPRTVPQLSRSAAEVVRSRDPRRLQQVRQFLRAGRAEGPGCLFLLQPNMNHDGHDTDVQGCRRMGEEIPGR